MGIHSDRDQTRNLLCHDIFQHSVPYSPRFQLLQIQCLTYNCISTNDSFCVIKLLLQIISFVIVICIFSAIINAIKPNFSFSFSGEHLVGLSRVGGWHFLNDCGWENEGAEEVVGNSQWFIRVQKSFFVGQLGMPGLGQQSFTSHIAVAILRCIFFISVENSFFWSTSAGPS